MGVPTLKEVFDEKYYLDLDGGILESFGRLFKNDLKLYVYPLMDKKTGALITSDNLLLRMDDEEWYKVIETNLNAIYRMSKACLKPMFRARWGRIISVGSVVGSSGNSGQVNYTAAKAGVVGFSKSLAQEIGSRGITVNVVAPGFIDTDMTSALPDIIKEELLKRIPLRRLGQAEDVANAVAFLASESAKYITGETIHVNGGMYMN